jgi:mycothiol synthase
MRPYTGEDDLGPIADLHNRCAAFDELKDYMSAAELGLELGMPSVDQGRDLRLWEDADGRLLGYGRLLIAESDQGLGGRLWLRVDPAARGQDLEPQIIAWAEERMREVGRERGKPAALRSGAVAGQADRIALLERHGFVSERYFFTMARPLAEPIEEPVLPAGFTICHMDPKRDTEAWTAMFNQSFVDHWNHVPLTVEELRHWLTDSKYRPEMDQIAIAPNGTFAAFCYAEIDPGENAHTGRNEGWINLLGSRRGFRKIGLGRAMLLAGLRVLRAGGVETAKLGVDADNPTGALRLYESIGFQRVETRISYRKDV